MNNTSISIPEHLRDLDRAEMASACFKKAKSCLKTYDDFAHKGTRGHAAVIAGSHGMLGAAVLANKACSKSGVGKTTAFVPESAFQLVHQTVPESLVQDIRAAHIDLSPFHAIGIGPGMGISSLTGDLLEQCFQAGKPLVLDADALNYLSIHPEMLKKIPPGSILTPHLLEWERLFGHVAGDRQRIEKSWEVSAKLGVCILIKGHYSILTTPDGTLQINGTGNSGMAKAGSGDVLTGLLSGLLGQGYTGEQAGILGMCVHGLSGDHARETIGEDAMTASDLIDALSKAFRTLRN